ncbi:MAG TPA: MGMT family protein [Dehalococcoidia bacterium]|nr:MGMT family protein [Dehalococcoidia bacterium]
MTGWEAFRERVYAAVSQVPPGRVVTYGQVADHLGAPRSARLVGRALRTLPRERDDVPWHRVVNRAGLVSARHPTVRMDLQWALLRAEGTVPGPTGQIDFARHGWAWVAGCGRALHSV